jgi:CDP-4-dehydro-6-deoxyglucose reductase, E3
MGASEFSCTVRALRMLTPTVFELTFNTAQPLEFKAGQFISVVVPGAGPKGRDLRRAYSIASAPETLPIELCVKLVEEGPGTNYLYKLKPGETFRGYAPYGDFVYEPKPGRHVCFVATGTGIAPFRAMIFSSHYKAQPPASVSCLLGVRKQEELLYVEDFASYPGMKWVTAVTQPDPGWSGYRGRVTDYLRGLGDDYPWRETDFYLCGNGEMIKEVKEVLGQKGVEKDSIHQEKYY